MQSWRITLPDDFFANGSQTGANDGAFPRFFVSKGLYHIPYGS